jgi:hypothetical protein
MTGLIGYIVVLSRGVNFIGLTFHSVTLIKNLHALHLDEWRFHLVKGFHWKSLEKSVFTCWVDSAGPWGGRSVGFWDLFNIWGFWQSFSRKFTSWRTVRESKVDGLLLTSKLDRTGCTRVDRADGPRVPRRTVHRVLADSPPGPTDTSDSSWLRVFTVGIQTRTVREGIADSPWGTRFLHNGQ